MKKMKGLTVATANKLRKAAVKSHHSVDRRTASVNRSLKCGLHLEGEALYIGRVALDMPHSVSSLVREHLYRGVGTAASLARRLNSYGVSEWERRFLSVFREDEVTQEWAVRRSRYHHRSEDVEDAPAVVIVAEPYAAEQAGVVLDAYPVVRRKAEVLPVAEVESLLDPSRKGEGRGEGRVDAILLSPSDADLDRQFDTALCRNWEESDVARPIYDGDQFVGGRSSGIREED